MLVLVDLDDGTVVATVEGRRAVVLLKPLAAQGDEWLARAEQVAIDPGTPYAKAVRRLLCHTQLIVDKFRVLRLFGRAVEQVIPAGQKHYLPDRSREGPPPAHAVEPLDGWWREPAVSRNRRKDGSVPARLSDQPADRGRDRGRHREPARRRRRPQGWPVEHGRRVLPGVRVGPIRR